VRAQTLKPDRTTGRGRIQ